MDVIMINPEKVRNRVLSLSFSLEFNGIFIQLRLVLLRKLVHVPSWPLRGSQPTSEQKVWFVVYFLSNRYRQADLSVSSRWCCTNGLHTHSLSLKT